MAETSSGGGENLPRGWRKNCALSPSSQYFSLSYNLIYAHFFDILDTWYEEIQKVFFFLVHLLSFIRFSPATSYVQEGPKALEMVRGWRGGPRHPPESASVAKGYLHRSIMSFAFLLTVYKLLSSCKNVYGTHELNNPLGNYRNIWKTCFMIKVYCCLLSFFTYLYLRKTVY